MIITLRNKFHNTERRFRLGEKHDDGVVQGWTLSLRACKAWFCDYKECKCSHMVECITPGYQYAGRDFDGAAIIVEVGE